MPTKEGSRFWEGITISDVAKNPLQTIASPNTRPNLSFNAMALNATQNRKTRSELRRSPHFTDPINFSFAFRDMALIANSRFNALL